MKGLDGKIKKKVASLLGFSSLLVHQVNILNKQQQPCLILQARIYLANAKSLLTHFCLLKLVSTPPDHRNHYNMHSNNEAMFIYPLFILLHRSCDSQETPRNYDISTDFCSTKTLHNCFRHFAIKQNMLTNQNLYCSVCLVIFIIFPRILKFLLVLITFSFYYHCYFIIHLTQPLATCTDFRY